MSLQNSFLLVCILALTVGCRPRRSAGLADTTNSMFQVGEVWSYHARPGEETSTVTVLKLESSPYLGNVIHVAVNGLRVKSARVPGGLVTGIGHIALSEEATRQSLVSRLQRVDTLPPFEQGYAHWLDLLNRGRGDVCTNTLISVVDGLEHATQR
ncbi:MAG: hypothetical protein EXS36_03700 [Pedosphaera sp.]|nr:hypothetical protein [Pedosphaera sp.]